MDTERPGLADVSLFFLLTWFKAFKPLKEIYTAHPIAKTIAVSLIPLLKLE